MWENTGRKIPNMDTFYAVDIIKFDKLLLDCLLFNFRECWLFYIDYINWHDLIEKGYLIEKMDTPHFWPRDLSSYAASNIWYFN